MIIIAQNGESVNTDDIVSTQGNTYGIYKHRTWRKDGGFECRIFCYVNGRKKTLGVFTGNDSSVPIRVMDREVSRIKASIRRGRERFEVRKDVD